MIQKLMVLQLIAALISGTGHGKGGDMPAVAIEKSRVDSGSQKIDPEHGYIALTSTRQDDGKGPQRSPVVFLRQPDDATMIAWRADMDKAMVKAKKKYANDLDSWQDQVQLAAQAKTKPPEKPAEPTEASLDVKPPEIRDNVAIGPMFAYEKSAETISYLEAVKPGTYIYYGPLIMTGDGAVVGSHCFCMGTVAFEVKPGVITDLGDMLSRMPDVDNAEILPTGKLAKPGDKPIAHGPYTMTATTGLPQGVSVVPARLQAHGKVNNYYGLFVSRLGAIEGVLGYHRDKVVDLRSGQELVDPTITSHDKPKA